MAQIASHAKIEEITQNLFEAGFTYSDAMFFATTEAANDAKHQLIIESYNKDLSDVDSSRISPFKDNKETYGSKSDKLRQASIMANMNNNGLADLLGKFISDFSLSDLAGNMTNCKKAADQIIDQNIEQIAQDIPNINDDAVREQASQNLSQVMSVQAFVIQTAIPIEKLSSDDVSCSAEQAFDNDQSCVNTSETVTDIQDTSGVKMNQTENGTTIELEKGFMTKTEALLGNTLSQANLDLTPPKPNEVALSPLELKLG